MRCIVQCAALAALIGSSGTLQAQTYGQSTPSGSQGVVRCDNGNLSGPISSKASPDEAFQCKLIGRVFCLVEEKREQNVPEKIAINDVTEAMSHLGETGSHVPTNFRPEVTLAASYVYTHDKMLPWTRYYYAAYSCGFNQRVADAATRSKLSPIWEKSASECQRAHPGEGTGYPNDSLRDCLQNAMDAITKQATARK